ncbi:MAG: Fic family protein [Candidatus Pacebacteria bacterium]|nr:Fic family protein [Candidatus Paceibacterota bacterium]
MLSKKYTDKIKKLKDEFNKLKKGKESLLKILNEVEIPEAVYNSNAIENSTLTIDETEKILLDLEISRNVSLREVFEARNLGVVTEYIYNNKKRLEIDIETILLLHKMLISNINDKIAGRFRQAGEYVRVGRYIAPAPEKIQFLLDELLEKYQDSDEHVLNKVSEFHLLFEKIHPFIDGNGRIGRILINLMLLQNGFPPIIIKDSEKQYYYASFRLYDQDKKQEALNDFSKIIFLQLSEAFNKRIAYLKAQKIVSLSEYSKKKKESKETVFNKAKRQTIPAFREKGVWKIGV